MTMTLKVLLGVLVVTVLASIPIITNVSNRINVLPESTPLEVPHALQKLQNADESYASESGTPNLQDPQSHYSNRFASPSPQN